uniref:Uncharacterized protein n=1 Tax=Janibacter limosus TaxID=53458 RepID=A0AC61U3Z4_9MICO|nr:hypothetical protein [Janibacter limosus]
MLLGLPIGCAAALGLVVLVRRAMLPADIPFEIPLTVVPPARRGARRVRRDGASRRAAGAARAGQRPAALGAAERRRGRSGRRGRGRRPRGARCRRAGHGCPQRARGTGDPDAPGHRRRGSSPPASSLARLPVGPARRCAADRSPRRSPGTRSDDVRPRAASSS